MNCFDIYFSLNNLFCLDIRQVLKNIKQGSLQNVQIDLFEGTCRAVFDEDLPYPLSQTSQSNLRTSLGSYVTGCSESIPAGICIKSLMLGNMCVCLGAVTVSMSLSL